MRPSHIVLALLAGCAAPTMEERIWQSSNVQLCEAIAFGNRQVSAMAEHEARNRGINCQDYAQAVLSLRQQRAQAAQILLQRPAYQPAPPMQIPPPPQRTTCRTYQVGNTLQTDCQ